MKNEYALSESDPQIQKYPYEYDVWKLTANLILQLEIILHKNKTKKNKKQI
jgi:hypothetical protein